MRMISDRWIDDKGSNRTVGKLRKRVVCLSGVSLEGSRRVPECSSPAKVAFCRLLSIVRKCRGGGNKGFPAMEERENGAKMSQKFIDDDDDNGGGDRSLLPGSSPENCVVSVDDHVSGCQKQEITFNLAAGLGLLSLIAASKTELDKTMELRREMEGFLRGIKEENQSNAATPKRSDHGHEYAAAVSTTLDGPSYVSHYSYEDHALLVCQPESGISMVSDNCYNVYENVVHVEGMNHLEEELAAELDRLQVGMEIGKISESQEVSAEKNNKQHGEELAANNATQSVSVSPEEVVVDPEEEDTVGNDAEFCGVPPLELERRLHELLEFRQEERIKELEARVERMKRRLEEKEVEVTWWKDTAKLMSKQIPDLLSS